MRTISGGTETGRAVVLGERITRAGVEHVEILTGLVPGDVVITP